MTDTRSKSAALGRAMRAVGKATLVSGRWVGRRARDAYHAVDPDVRQHLAELPLVAPTLIGSRHREIAALPDDGHPPCLFVHGLNGHPHNFALAKLWFRLHGRRRTYSFGYEDGAPLEQSAERLASTIDAIFAINELEPSTRIDVVAHSMGGLVARLALRDKTVALRVRTLVTLGTPHAGTLAARFMGTARGIDLRPGSPLIAELASQEPWAGPPKLPRLVALWSRADIFILPHESARVAGAENVEVGGVSHNGYLIRPTILARVLAALASPT